MGDSATFGVGQSAALMRIMSTPMFNVLIDTSVWLDLAEDTKQTPLLDVVERLVKDGQMRLLVPRIVVDEFHKNRDKIAKSSARGLSTHFNHVKAAIRKADGEKRQKTRVLDYLSDLDHRIPIMGGAAEGVLKRIAVIFSESTIIEATDAVKLRAADRALHRRRTGGPSPCRATKSITSRTRCCRKHPPTGNLRGLTLQPEAPARQSAPRRREFP